MTEIGEHEQKIDNKRTLTFEHDQKYNIYYHNIKNLWVNLTENH